MNDFKITTRDDAAASIPRVLRVSAAVSWRALVILGALYVLGLALGRVYVVVIPVAIALLLAALLAPAVASLARHGVPRSLATALVLIGGLAIVGGVLTFVINAFVEGFPDLQSQVLASLNTLKGWLALGPLHINEQQIGQYLNQAQQWLAANQAALTSGALSTAGTFGNFLTGLVLALFTLIYFLYDGRRVWLFVTRLAPKHVRHRVDVAGCRGFASLVGFVRATALVAVVDALGIGLGLAILGVPLAIPLAALVFLGGFVPIVGAVASGAVAVLVALVTKGWIVALIVVGIVLAVQQIEGNVLQPLILGRAVQIHALGVVLAISIGLVVSGIIGALLAVPLVAVLNSAIRSLVAEEEPEEPPEPTEHEESEPPPDETPDEKAPTNSSANNEA
ncbi:AI-2E family transporter [Saccharopolyspora phatthalungensis]|uniref:Putative PurR-regulated permease PerM n=1 Tax=Saccharopolyspora phatthalungensis TaxID=664693 RepID=A0A840Q6R2_9PSEU|nr:AI-2E family transporter [Saccharopolyspora phatthalungensis]MBB5154339.1 putative PurR-regulated permease PerM [Saccharopolyspora phatthalungensis]